MEHRAIRPPSPEEITPNPNDPASVPPSTVGPDQLVVPGDPEGVVLVGETGSLTPPARVLPSAWSGWPLEWWPPLWGNSHLTRLGDIAWMCLDTNASLLATMPPYLVNAAPSLDADWLRNPDPDLYGCWEDMAKELFWAYQGLGEAFLLATARYSTGWPARFHVLPNWAVNVEMGGDGLRSYRVGEKPVAREDILHIRYQGSVDDARGHGPLEAGAARLVAIEVLHRYATTIASQAGIPFSILKHPESLNAAQALELKTAWVTARASAIGEPAVLGGGITWEPTQMNPRDMALLELTETNEARIAYMLKVPAHLVGLPSGGDSLTYSTVVMQFLHHWRWGLRPMAQTVMSNLSGWLLPRDTRVELNRDSYIEPEPLIRAQTAQILAAITDPTTGQQALTVDEIRAAERLDNSTPTDLSSGVLR